jgi:hypothetical protein
LLVTVVDMLSQEINHVRARAIIITRASFFMGNRASFHQINAHIYYVL